MTTNIELSIEDGVCVARRTTPAIVPKAGNAGSVLDTLCQMSEEELLAVRGDFGQLKPIIDGIANTKRILSQFPDASGVTHCRCERGNPFGFCQHPKLHNVLWVREKFDLFDRMGPCNRCGKALRINSVGEGRRLERTNTHWHIHADVTTENGIASDAILYLYDASAYIVAKRGDVPTDVFSALRRSPAPLNQVASPEIIATKVTNPQRIRDPLLLAGWSDNTADWYIIHQWE